MINTLENLDNLNINDIYENAFKLVQFGWKQEAVPVVHEKSQLFQDSLNFFLNKICFLETLVVLISCS